MDSKKLIGYAVGPIGSSILGFITLPIITWFYSVEDVGRVSMLQVFTSFFILLFCLGLDQAYVREFHSTKEKAQLFKTTLLPGLLLSILSLIVVLCYDSTIIALWLYDIPDTYLSIITIICFIIALISRFLSLIIRMQERALAFSMSQLLPKILFLFFILFTVWLQFSRDTYNLLTANALSIVFTFLIFSWNTRTDLIATFKYKIEKGQLRQVLAFGLPLVIGGLASWGLNVMDRIFLRNMSTYTELGIYSVAMSIAGVAALFSGIFNTIWAPMVFKWVGEGNIDYKKIDDISEYVLAAIYFLVVFSGLFSWIIPIFLPQSYVEIQFIITACLLGPLLYTLSETTAVGIAIARKTKLAMLASIFAVLINLVGNYILVPEYGTKGAAAATAIAFWSFFILRTEFSKLVWYKIPVLKSYICVTLLTLCAVMSMFLFLDNLFAFISLWLVLLFLGLFIFFNKIKRLIVYIKDRLLI